ncbi:hypothetical protein QFZ71_003677 [Streptomyces sp. V2I9]|nr:hypothetical protein [Streptomyces sp. V2I9]
MTVPEMHDGGDHRTTTRPDGSGRVRTRHSDPPVSIRSDERLMPLYARERR